MPCARSPAQIAAGGNGPSPGNPGGGVTQINVNGNWFFLSQPELLWDFGKLVRFTPAKIYLGFEYQIAFHRYLIENKTENVLQGMVRWNI